MSLKQDTKTPANKGTGAKRQQMFAFIGLVLFLTGLVATALKGEFSLITVLLCLLGIGVGSVMFLPRVTRNLAVYTNMTLYSVFFCAAAIVFFMILQRHPLTYDSTESGVYSLSGVTTNFLERLDQPIEATAFISDKQQRNAATVLLSEYRRYSPQFNYRILDPFTETAEARRYGSEILPGTVFLERMTTDTATRQADRAWKVDKLAEEQLTNGIVQLLRGEVLKLYFTTGHGEPRLEEDRVASTLRGQSDTSNNLQSLFTMLQSSYINAEEIQIGAVGAIPPDASAVIVVRPRVDFTPGEARILRTYLENGGRVMFLLNPNIPQPQGEIQAALVNIADLLRDYGVQMTPDVVVMPLNQNKNESILITEIAALRHRITQGLPLQAAFTKFHETQPMLIGSTPPNVVAETFLQSAKESWPFPLDELQRAIITRTNPRITAKMEDLKAISVGVAVTHMDMEKGESGASKIVAIGNGSFLTSRYLSNPQWVMFMNAVNWLTDSGDLVAIPSSQMENTPSILTPRQQQFLFILVVIAIPTLIALGGLGYSISRRGGL